MNQDLIYNFKKLGGVSDIYTISTDCGVYDGYDCVTKKTGYGFDAYNEIYCDMMSAGIVDPAKVTRSALQNAASIASVVLTTDVSSRL